jgi:hypothetical protein
MREKGWREGRKRKSRKQSADVHVKCFLNPCPSSCKSSSADLSKILYQLTFAEYCETVFSTEPQSPVAKSHCLLATASAHCLATFVTWRLSGREERRRLEEGD